jgi:hypothetical protein
VSYQFSRGALRLYYVPLCLSSAAGECCHKTQNCPVDSTSFAAGLFRSVYFVTCTRHFSIQDLYLWTGLSPLVSATGPATLRAERRHADADLSY